MMNRRFSAAAGAVSISVPANTQNRPKACMARPHRGKPMGFRLRAERYEGVNLALVEKEAAEAGGAAGAANHNRVAQAKARSAEQILEIGK